MPEREMDVMQNKVKPAHRVSAESEELRLKESDVFDDLAPRAGGNSWALAHATRLNRTTALRPFRAQQSLLQLQRQYGNRYVQRVLEESEIMRKLMTSVPGGSDQSTIGRISCSQDEPVVARRQRALDPLRRQSADAASAHLQSARFADSAKLERCFENKDRLGENDPDTDAVKRIQQALNDLRGITGNRYDLEVDGLYGPKTADAIRKFKRDEQLGSTQFGDVGPGTMRRLDKLFGPIPPKPVPPEPVPPKPVPPSPTPVDNQELEAVLNVISNAYQLLLTRQRDGVLALCRDLSHLDKPQEPAGLQMLKDMLIVLLTFEWGVGEGAIRQAISKALDDALKPHQERVKDIDEGFSQLASVMQQVGQQQIESMGNPSIKTLEHLLAKFCDRQLAQVTAQGSRAIDEFELHKATFRMPVAGQAHDKRNQSGDPRVDVAWETVDAIHSQAEKAFDIHYDTARRAWSSQIAQSQLGKAEEDIKDTNLAPLKGDADIPPGVLEIRLFPHLDGKGEDLTGAQISGLSEEVRNGLTGKKAGELHLPIVADGPTGGRRMRIGIPESQEGILDLTDSRSGGQWLEERGEGDRRQGVLRVADSVLSKPVPEVEGP